MEDTVCVECIHIVGVCELQGGCESVCACVCGCVAVVFDCEMQIKPSQGYDNAP